MPSGAASVVSSATASPALGSAGSSVAPINRRASPSNGNGAATATPLSSFPAYEVEDEAPRTGTPPPIKVTRAKKKTKTTSGSGKKRAAASAASTPSGGAL